LTNAYLEGTLNLIIRKRGH